MIVFARALAVLLVVLGFSSASSAGTVGPEFKVNKYTTSNQRVPDVAHLGDGGFVIVWESSGQDGSGYGIYGQRYDAAGKRVGKREFQINKTNASDQRNSRVVGLTDGGFLVAWDSFDQDGEGWGVYAQRYDAAGKKVGKREFRVNKTTASDQSAPDMAALLDGGFAIVWNSSNQDGDAIGVFGQRYNSAGKRVGTREFKVNKTTDSSQSQPSVAGLEDGGFVIIWKSYGQGGSGFAVFGQRYDATGKRVGKREFMISKALALQIYSSSVAGLADGGFVVTYDQYDLDDFILQVYGQRYDAAGKRAGKREFQVSKPAFGDDERSSHVAALDGGGFVVIWESEDGDGDSWGIVGQRYDANGKRVGAREFPVNSHTTSYQYNSAVAGMTGGGFIATWQSNAQDGSSFGVYGQRFSD